LIKKTIFLCILFISFFGIAQENLMPIEISYGSLEKQKIDFYEGKSDKILIWIHGGGWLFGDKSSERWIRRFHNHFLDHENRNIYMIGYRTGEATAPYAVDDVMCAYKKILEDANYRNFSKDDIVVAGASAGGHLALMVGFASDSFNGKCISIIKPKSVINIFGITEIKKTSEFLDKTKFFKASNYVREWIGPDLRISQLTKDLSPVYLINENSPNVLTVHGTSDRWVPYDQALLLDEKLGDKHKLLTIEGGGHYGFSEDEDNLIRQTIASFLIENYKNNYN
jgi:acetyl esterase/lipase